MNKFLMLGIAGLAFAACSNEEELAGQFPEGNGMVEVFIASPSTKTVADATTGEGPVVVGGDITVEVTTATETRTATIERNAIDADNQEEYVVRFYGISQPTKIVAYCNDGKAVNDATSISITDARLQSIPTSIPAYGETSSVEEKGEMTNVENPSDETIYKRYVAEVALQIPVARIELSGLVHVTHASGETCRFEDLVLNGIYLDKIFATKDAPTVTDYFWGESTVFGETPSANAPILYDIIGGDNGIDFKTTTALPGNGDAYAYNFFADGEHNPELKIYFGTASPADPTDLIEEPRYVIAKTYKEDGQPVNFVPGKIYRITSAILTDGHIGPNEEGESEYGLELTVVEAQWSVTDITADWVVQ